MPPYRRRSVSSIRRKRHVTAGLPDLITIGYYPLCDAAPILIAQHQGIFRKNGLNVQLKKEIGWSTLLRKLEQGHFQAVHAPAALLFQPWQNTPAPDLILQTAYILNVQGTAITLSSKYAVAGIRTGAQLAQHLLEVEPNEILKIGVSSHFSSHKIFVLEWLDSLNIATERVEFVVLPPRQMPPNLSNNNIDAFCADEPWNNYCVHLGTGFCEVTSPEVLNNEFPEKGLITTRLFAKKNPETHAAIVQSINQAAAYCDNTEYSNDVAKTLSHHLDIEPSLIQASFSSIFLFGVDRDKSQKKLLHFTGDHVNRPDSHKGEWIRDGLVRSGLIPTKNAPSNREIRSIFRGDIYDDIFAEKA